MGLITLGYAGGSGNTRLTFDVSRVSNCNLDRLHITISSRRDADFENKITIDGVTRADIDEICSALCEVKSDLRK